LVIFIRTDSPLIVNSFSKKESDMDPKITSTSFGQIVIGKKVYEHDVLIDLEGNVKKRRNSAPLILYPERKRNISMKKGQNRL